MWRLFAVADGKYVFRRRTLVQFDLGGPWWAVTEFAWRPIAEFWGGH